MKSNIKLYGHYVMLHVKSMMQYKISFFLSVLGQFLVSFNIFLGIFFMFRRFSSVDGFCYSEVLLCFSIMLMEFSLAESFARGFDEFPSLVKSGEFDRVLIRPRGTIIQVLGSKFELTRCGRILQAIVMFVYGICKSNIEWNVLKVFTIICMLVGGTALFAGLFLIYAALSFFTLDGLEFMNIFTDGAREYGKYPIGVYGKKMLWLCTFIIPYALVQYYPLIYLIGRRQSAVWVFVPLLAMLFLIPCLALWKFGVRRYQSSGS